MKAFYEQYASGATWTCPSDGMWGGWDIGGMMGGHDWDAAHMWGTGYGAAWMTSHPARLRPAGSTMRGQADGARRPPGRSSYHDAPQEQRGADGAEDHARAPSRAGQDLLPRSTT